MKRLLLPLGLLCSGCYDFGSIAIPATSDGTSTLGDGPTTLTDDASVGLPDGTAAAADGSILTMFDLGGIDLPVVTTIDGSIVTGPDLTAPSPDLVVVPDQTLVVDLAQADLGGRDQAAAPDLADLAVAWDLVVTTDLTRPPDFMTAFDLSVPMIDQGGTTPLPDFSNTGGLPDLPTGTSGWTKRNTGTQVTLNSVWGNTAVVIAVGEGGTILRSTDGGANFVALSNSATTASLRGIHGFNLNDINIVGSGGTILHSVDGGATWQPQSSTDGKDLFSVWSGFNNEAYAVGAGGKIIRRAAASAAWSDETSGVSSDLRAIWAVNLADLYAVGDGATILRKNGSGWQPMALIANPGTFHGVMGTPNDIFVVGPPFNNMNSAIERMNPSMSLIWMLQDSTIKAPLDGVWASPSEVFAVGVMGAVVRTTNNGVTWMVDPTGRTEDLRGIWGSGAQNMFAVGTSGLILHRP